MASSPGHLPEMAPGSPARPGRTTLMTITTTTAGPGRKGPPSPFLEVLAARRLGTRTVRVLKITGTRSAVADLAHHVRRNRRLALPPPFFRPPAPPRPPPWPPASYTSRPHPTSPMRLGPGPRTTGSYRTWTSSAKTSTLAILGHALTETLGHHSLEIFTIPTRSPITSPAQPGRGTVRITTMAPSPGTPASAAGPRARTALTSPTSRIHRQVIEIPPVLPV